MRGVHHRKCFPLHAIVSLVRMTLAQVLSSIDNGIATVTLNR